MSITVDGKLRDRCAEFIAKISPTPEDDVKSLEAFVLSEIGRAASEKLADSSALVLFFASPEGAEEVAKAIQEAMPGLVERKWP
jgi:hypothetical protein